MFIVHNKFLAFLQNYLLFSAIFLQKLKLFAESSHQCHQLLGCMSTLLSHWVTQWIVVSNLQAYFLDFDFVSIYYIGHWNLFSQPGVCGMRLNHSLNCIDNGHWTMSVRIIANGTRHDLYERAGLVHIGPVAHFVDVGVTRNVKGCQKLQSGWPTHFVDQHIC